MNHGLQVANPAPCSDCHPRDTERNKARQIAIAPTCLCWPLYTILVFDPRCSSPNFVQWYPIAVAADTSPGLPHPLQVKILMMNVALPCRHTVWRTLLVKLTAICHGVDRKCRCAPQAVAQDISPDRFDRLPVLHIGSKALYRSVSAHARAIVI